MRQKTKHWFARTLAVVSAVALAFVLATPSHAAAKGADGRGAHASNHWE